MRTPTHEEIEAAKTKKGGWTRETLAAWGVPWPPPKGWRARLEGRSDDEVSSVEYMQSLKNIRKTERSELWDRRVEGWFKPLVAAGFSAMVMDYASRHCRASVPGRGFFDFWPSTGRWAQSARKGAKCKARGFGVETMIKAMEDIRTKQ